ncbi:MAG TPA: MFS transporter [Casimicrobiaceae bacterium]|nr:MFS transporter [Casimicrobiaceae bacterium]
MSTPLRRNRDFLLLQAGQLFSTFGSAMSTIAYPLLALVLTGSAAKVGVVGAVEFLPVVLLSPAAGVAADHFDRRRLMIAADAVGAAALAVLAMAVLTHHGAYWLILVVAFVDTAAATFFRAGMSGAFKAIVPAAQLAGASSISMARLSIIRLAGPPAGGAIFGLARGLPFLADAISYGFSTISLVFMRTPFQEEREPGERPRFREGLAYFWSMPFLRTTIGMVAVSNLAASGMPIVVIILAHRHGLSSATIGGFLAATGVALLAGSTLSPVLRRLFPMRAILLSEFWSGLFYAAFLVYPNIYVLATVTALHAFWFPNTDSAMYAYSYALIPDRLLGRAMAASSTLRAVSAPIGPLLAGVLLSHTSSRTTVFVLAVPVVVAAVLGTMSAATRDLPALATESA